MLSHPSFFCLFDRGVPDWQRSFWLAGAVPMTVFAAPTCAEGTQRRAKRGACCAIAPDRPREGPVGRVVGALAALRAIPYLWG